MLLEPLSNWCNYHHHIHHHHHHYHHHIHHHNLVLCRGIAFVKHCDLSVALGEKQQQKPDPVYEPLDVKLLASKVTNHVTPHKAQVHCPRCQEAFKSTFVTESQRVDS